MEAYEVDLVQVGGQLAGGRIGGLAESAGANVPELDDAIVAGHGQALGIERIPLEVHDVAAIHQRGYDAVHQPARPAQLEDGDLAAGPRERHGHALLVGMEAIAFARYLAAQVAQVLNVRRLVAGCALQMPELGHLAKDGASALGEGRAAEGRLRGGLLEASSSAITPTMLLQELTLRHRDALGIDWLLLQLLLAVGLQGLYLGVLATPG